MPTELHTNYLKSLPIKLLAGQLHCTDLFHEAQLIALGPGLDELTAFEPVDLDRSQFDSLPGGFDPEQRSIVRSHHRPSKRDLVARGDHVFAGERQIRK